MSADGHNAAIQKKRGKRSFSLPQHILNTKSHTLLMLQMIALLRVCRTRCGNSSDLCIFLSLLQIIGGSATTCRWRRRWCGKTGRWIALGALWQRERSALCVGRILRCTLFAQVASTPICARLVSADYLRTWNLSIWICMHIHVCALHTCTNAYTCMFTYIRIYMYE